MCSIKSEVSLYRSTGLTSFSRIVPQTQWLHLCVVVYSGMETRRTSATPLQDFEFYSASSQSLASAGFICKNSLFQVSQLLWKLYLAIGPSNVNARMHTPATLMLVREILQNLQNSIIKAYEENLKIYNDEKESKYKSEECISKLSCNPQGAGCSKPTEEGENDSRSEDEWEVISGGSE